MSRTTDARTQLELAEELADRCASDPTNQTTLQRAIVYAIIGLARTIEGK